MIEFQLSRKGIIFVVSAPSGGGKSTVLRAILQADPTLTYSISATTRAARGSETHGKEYYFLSVSEFEKQIDEDGFIEYAKVHGNYYGTLKSEVDRKINTRQDVMLDIDVQGSLRLKSERPDTVLVFILPPSIATLEKRLRSRGLDDEAAMRLRLQNARNEIRYAQLYDYVLVNEDLERTIAGINAIVAAERCKSHRCKVLDALGEVEFIPAVGAR